jgi:hypothetical protein
MKLVLMQPPAKPPFIGIIPSSYMLAKGFNGFEENARNELFDIILSPEEDKLFIEAKTQFHAHAAYVHYNPTELLMFLAATHRCSLFNFGYVINEGHGHKLLHIGKGPAVIKIKSVKLIERITPGTGTHI